MSPSVSTSQTHHNFQADAGFQAKHTSRLDESSDLSSNHSKLESNHSTVDESKGKHKSHKRSPQNDLKKPTNDGHASRFRNEGSQSRSSSRQKHSRLKFRRARVGRTQRDSIRPETYVQWGFIRHQHSGNELLAARKAFRLWKVKVRHLLQKSEPDWPWKQDAQWLVEYNTVAGMRSAWQELDIQARKQQWPRIMLSTMRLYPAKAGMVLEATLDPWPPGYAIHDVLLFIVQRLDPAKAKNIRQRTLEAEEAADLLHKVMTDSPKQHVPLSQRLFGLFAKKLPSEQVFELFSLLRRSGFKLHANTLIHFASTLAKHPAHKEHAFEILKALSESGADLNEARPSSVITSLLHCQVPEGAESTQGNSFSHKDALQYFIERGFALNLLSATAFLDTLTQQGEIDEAIRLALLFSESGIRLDRKAWATLFRGAKTSRKVETVAKALDVAKVADVPFVEVLNNALHSVFHFAEMEGRERRREVPSGPALFATLLRIFAKKFDMEPLQWWLPDSLPLLLAQGTGHQSLVPNDSSQTRWQFDATIVPFVDQLFSSGGDTKLKPNLTTIAIMMRAYIRSLRGPYDLMAYYQFFKSRLEEQGKNASLPSASRLIQNQGTLIHDTIIFAMTEHKELSRPALQVFGDMLKDHHYSNDGNAAKAHVEKDGLVASRPIHPAPTVLTFSILLRGLLKNHDKMLARQVIQVMREHGIGPNRVTWNTLTSGYATMQDVPKTVSTLQDMEAAGFKPDVYTFKAFARLKNQEKALQMMEQVIDTNRQKMAEEELHE